MARPAAIVIPRAALGAGAGAAAAAVARLVVVGP